jgi:hypothetical protein
VRRYGFVTDPQLEVGHSAGVVAHKVEQSDLLPVPD